MSFVATVISFARTVFEGAQAPETTVDDGSGSLKTAQHYAPVGDGSAPLEDDFAALTQAPGAGAVNAVGYLDTVNTISANPGEVYRYARSPDGTIVAEIYLKNDGAIEITSVAGSNVTINGVVIDSSGNISAPGDVTAKAGAASVTLSTHVHPTGTGPSGSPTPGT